MRCSRCGREFPSAYYFQTDEICRECFAKVPEAERADLLRHAESHGLHTSTTFQVDGYRVVKPLGLVRGITVRSRSIFGTLGGALQTIVGGNITMFTELCEKTRAEAFEMMLRHAREMGANAVIGVRYDATEVMDGVNEVLCYGTAVVIEPAAGG